MATKAEEIYNRTHALMEQGMSRSDAFDKIAEEESRPRDSIRGSFYSHKSSRAARPNHGHAAARQHPRMRWPTPSVTGTLDSGNDREVEAAEERAAESAAEAKALKASAAERKKAIAEHLEALRVETRAGRERCVEVAAVAWSSWCCWCSVRCWRRRPGPLGRAWDRAVVFRRSVRWRQIGLMLGLRCPERLSGLVLCNTTSRIPPEGRPIWDERIAQVEEGGMESQLEATLRRWFTDDFAAPTRRRWRGSPG